MSAPNQEGRTVFGPDQFAELAMPPQPQVVMPTRDYTPEELAERKAAADKAAELERAAMWAVRRAQLLAEARTVLGTLFELAGIGGLAWAGFAFAVWLGIAIGSLGLIIVGVALDPPALLVRRHAAESSDE